MHKQSEIQPLDTHPDHEETQNECRRPTRERRQPSWMKDYHCQTVSPQSPWTTDQQETNRVHKVQLAYPMQNYLTYGHLSPKYNCFLTSIDSVLEPVSFKEASKDERWIKAMKTEIQALEANKTWEIVDLPTGKVPIGCKWVYKVKYNSDGTIERYKARLVAKGYNQKEGVDYFDTFSPVIKMVTVRIVMTLAVTYGWSLFQMDVHNAFLQGDLNEEVYMTIPEGFNMQREKKVCKLRKSLYGLKQASRQWNEKLTKALIEGGFKQNMYDYSLFIKRRDHKTVMVLAYVDDLVITGNDLDEIVKVKTFLHSKFKIKDLGELRYFLGIEVARSRQGIILNQRKYALDLINDARLSGAKPLMTPIDQNVKLSKEGGDKEDKPLKEPGVYRRLVGRLIYLTMTRPDLSYAVHMLSQFVNNPMESHMNAAYRIIRYLKGCPGMGILLSPMKDFRLMCFCDSDWAACPDTRRSITGYLVKLGNSLISWKTRKQKTVSKSTAEAEYRALSEAVSEVVWLIGLLKDLGIKSLEPVTVKCDNRAAIQIASNPVFHERTKHIEIDCHFVRSKLEEGLISLQHVKTEEQEADVLTKGLSKQQHDYLLSKLGVHNLFTPNLRGSVESGP